MCNWTSPTRWRCSAFMWITGSQTLIESRSWLGPWWLKLRSWLTAKPGVIQIIILLMTSHKEKKRVLSLSLLLQTPTFWLTLPVSGDRGDSTELRKANACYHTTVCLPDLNQFSSFRALSETYVWSQHRWQQTKPFCLWKITLRQRKKA